jgi:CRP-like cAMP-binding protein
VDIESPGANMANPPIDFRLLAGAGVPARDFKAGDVIFRQGDPAQELFIPVSEKQFLFLISNTPYFVLNVMRVMAPRLRAANTAL